MKLSSFIIPDIQFKSIFVPLKFLFILLISYSLISCTATKRVFDFENSNSKSVLLRVLINETSDDFELNVDSKLILSDNSSTIAEVNKGNKIIFSVVKGFIVSRIQEKEFQSSAFKIESTDEILKVNGKKFRGVLKIFEKNSQVKLVNQITLEDYVKGVMTKEMPVGTGNENYNALKAFSICVRTYALNKLNEKKDFFDIYPDTRDQVYGGVDGETAYTNKIVDETIGEYLAFNDRLATIFYHSTCGGFTEDVVNVFGNQLIPYLISVEDGSDHYCKISPRYEWTENYSNEIFIDRLFKSNLIDKVDYAIKSVEVISRFNSGRVNELRITLVDKYGIEKIISLFGNSMRSIIRTADNNSILRSNFFDISLTENKNVVINGKGSGHGVGMCQWGAIGQSKEGYDYTEILNHYYPGTSIKNLYD